ncbi:hypothetical protein SAMN05446037_100627 [Anaerovirgula multivorans]|uniref:Uncharacterized protein n=1 Tax=Anaerovirgula multivorans TaxID=312168 RepID=A0A239CM88_9FIRM|nr:hypothetical protein [Anaerovirgula multivorans]SNS20801.1 hypothetical protein SAMN05446037_100627 [Anaerovirgula multivorans]
MVKTKEQELTEGLISGLLGNFISVPTNVFKVNDPVDGEVELNCWFAGRVAGYEVAHVIYDHMTQEFLEEPMESFAVLLCDGMRYQLSEDCEVKKITEEKFAEMVAEHQASQIMEKPKLLKPGEDF